MPAERRLLARRVPPRVALARARAGLARDRDLCAARLRAPAQDARQRARPGGLGTIAPRSRRPARRPGSIRACAPRRWRPSASPTSRGCGRDAARRAPRSTSCCASARAATTATTSSRHAALPARRRRRALARAGSAHARRGARAARRRHARDARAEAARARRPATTAAGASASTSRSPPARGSAAAPPMPARRWRPPTHARPSARRPARSWRSRRRSAPTCRSSPPGAAAALARGRGELIEPSGSRRASARAGLAGQLVPTAEVYARVRPPRALDETAAAGCRPFAADLPALAALVANDLAGRRRGRLPGQRGAAPRAARARRGGRRGVRLGQRRLRPVRRSRRGRTRLFGPAGRRMGRGGRADSMTPVRSYEVDPDSIVVLGKGPGQPPKSPPPTGAAAGCAATACASPR